MDKYLVQVESVKSSPVVNSNVAAKNTNTNSESKDAPIATSNKVTIIVQVYACIEPIINSKYKPKILKSRFKPPSFTSVKPSSVSINNTTDVTNTSNVRFY